MSATLPPSYETIFCLWARAALRRETTVDDYRKVLATFATFVETKEPAAIVRPDILGFRDSLAVQGQSPTTVSRKVGILKTLFRTAVDYELLTINPAEQVRSIYVARQKPRVAFSVDDLTRIFNSPIYTEDLRSVAGGGEACHWLPLLALFTGARVEELAQLLVADICSATGLGWYLDINDDAEHGHLKNAASRRRVPIHPILIACGFLDYLQSMRGSHLLFPGLKPNPRKKLGGYFSNFFSAYLRKHVGITDRRKVFHSFRHTFKDACRRIGIDESVHDALTGHTSPHAGRRYGNEQYPLEPLFAAIGKFEIQGLDLSHLHSSSISSWSPRPPATMISAYYGIVVSFQREQPVLTLPSPCVHARYHGSEASFSIVDNTLLAGTLPPAKQILVQAWIEIHRDELIANWENGKVSGEFFRIDPLR